MSTVDTERQNMSEDKEEKTVVPVQQEITGFAKRDEIVAFGKRIKAMLPAAKDLSDSHAYALAQYALSTDANPWRGELYAWEDWQGNLFLDEGYKLLVRWAKRQCDYTEKYEPITEGCNDGDIGFRCLILRKDHMPTMKAFTEMGADFKTAFELAATSAVGIVRVAEMFLQKDKKSKQGVVYAHKGDPIEPPNGWNWEQVARKRALKNALNQSHGAPSPKEIAAESWKVGNVETIQDDWQGVTPEMSIQEREAVAVYNAEQREREEDGHQVNAQQAIEELFEL